MLEEAANKQLSKHKPPKGAKWLSEETTSIVKKRRIAKAEGNHDRVKELNAREWKQPISIPIPKKRDSRACENNRTIFPIVYASKIFLKIIQKCLEQYLERVMPDEQSGFRKSRSTRPYIKRKRINRNNQRIST